jgi:hypothetical protein
MVGTKRGHGIERKRNVQFWALRNVVTPTKLKGTRPYRRKPLIGKISEYVLKSEKKLFYILF